MIISFPIFNLSHPESNYDQLILSIINMIAKFIIIVGVVDLFIFLLFD